jgi:hypothetical protein
MAMSHSPSSQQEEVRILVAFLVQPLVATCIGALIYPVVELTGRPFHGDHAFRSTTSALPFALGMGLVSLLITIFAALPLFVWLRSRGPVPMGKTLISGALLGNVPLGIAVVLGVGGAPTDPFAFTYGRLGAIHTLGIGSGVGVTCAAVFWWIAGRQLYRRDRLAAAFSDR